MDKVIGIDPGYTCFAIVCNCSPTGVHTFKFSKTPLVEIALTLRKQIESCTPDLAVIEGYSYASPYQLPKSGELAGVLKLVLEQQGIRYIVVPPTTLKKFATGSGRATKDIVVKEVFKRWKFDTNSHDLADAFVLYKIGEAILGNGQGLTKVQKEITNRLKKGGVCIAIAVGIGTANSFQPSTPKWKAMARIINGAGGIK